jgi:hypothetical protein
VLAVVALDTNAVVAALTTGVAVVPTTDAVVDVDNDDPPAFTFEFAFATIDDAAEDGVDADDGGVMERCAVSGELRTASGSVCCSTIGT